MLDVNKAYETVTEVHIPEIIGEMHCLLRLPFESCVLCSKNSICCVDTVHCFLQMLFSMLKQFNTYKNIQLTFTLVPD